MGLTMTKKEAEEKFCTLILESLYLLYLQEKTSHHTSLRKRGFQVPFDSRSSLVNST